MHSAAWKNRVISSWKKNIKVGAMKTIGDRFAMVAGNKANVNFIVLLLVVCLVVGCTVSAVEPTPTTDELVRALWAKVVNDDPTKADGLMQQYPDMEI